MDIFKLKIVVGDIQIELEGENTLVQKVFEDIRSNGLGKLTSQVPGKPVLSSPSSSISVLEENNQTPENSRGDTDPEKQADLPSLSNVVLSGTPKTEADWLLVCSIYCSDQGQKIFSKDDLKGKYSEAKRLTSNRSKNFSSNIKTLVSSKLISAINDNEFRLENAGLHRGLQIINGEIPSGQAKTVVPARKKAAPSYNLIDLGLSPEGIAEIKELWASHNHSTAIDKAVLAAWILKQQVDISDFNVNYLFTLLRDVGEPTNYNLASSITNAKNKKQFFNQSDKAGVFLLTSVGEDHVKDLEAPDNASK